MTALDLSVDMTRLDGAACAGYPADWWFADEPKGHETPDASANRRTIAEAAKAVCHGCPALADCGAYCRQHPTQTKFGIWAGKTARQRGYDHRGQRARKRVAA